MCSCINPNDEPMKNGICLIAIAAVRMHPDHKSEMVTQLLFGERFFILDKTSDWLAVELAMDHYRGWVARNQVEMLGDTEVEMLEKAGHMVTMEHMAVVKEMVSGNHFLLSAGSSLYANNGKSLTVCGKTFQYQGETISAKQSSGDSLARYAQLFLHTPYLWGGRSAFGIDCSGFVQIVCKMAGIPMARDASVQANSGENIHLINESLPGDLFFFDNTGEEITHTGILLGNDRIIHAHGKVRIDRVDHQGIFNTDTNTYSHRLRLIKRIIS